YIMAEAMPPLPESSQNTITSQLASKLNKQKTDSGHQTTPASRSESQHSRGPRQSGKERAVISNIDKRVSAEGGSKEAIQSPAKPELETQTFKKETTGPDAQQRASDISPELASKLVSIKTMVKQHAQAAELIQSVVEAIALSGFERVVFAVKVPQKKLLYGRFFAQDKAGQPFRQFNISIAQPNVFSLLMNKSQCLWINDGNRGKFWNRVPDAVKLMLQNDSFMAMSIFTQKHSVGLMYADRSDGKLAQTEYKRFQGLCRLLSEGMVEISHHQGG
ncbi:MAG: hypothetical protein ACN4GM_14950, partial [Gammaproteobacteria bacterium]